MKKIVITNSTKETLNLAKVFADQLKGGEVILLDGQLGAGKTMFAKGIARALGVDGEVTSPTFAIHNSYQGRLVLNHFDFYRIDEAEAQILGLDEFFGDINSVCLIEWSNNVAGLLPKKTISVQIEKLDENSRKVVIDEYTGN